MELISREYAERMVRKHHGLSNSISPSAWDLKRLRPGYMLDVGCGIGRQLGFVNGHGVGVDPNMDCVTIARARGLNVVTPQELDSPPATFDSMLVAHVFEHLSHDDGVDLLRQYIDYIKPGGQVILIAPQEKGFGSDPTHIRFVDLEGLKLLVNELNLETTAAYSFPLPRAFGPIYIGNEFRLTARKR